MDFEIYPICAAKSCEILCSRILCLCKKCLCIAGYGNGSTYWALDIFQQIPTVKMYVYLLGTSSNIFESIQRLTNRNEENVTGVFEQGKLWYWNESGAKISASTLFFLV